MNVFQRKKMNRERGSATVEAAISFTGFLFVIFTILNIINFCRAQMLISNAVDTATKELTEYAYFYKMSGLQKFKDQLGDIGDQGKVNLNDVLGTVDSLYTSLGTAVDNTAGNITNVKNAAQAGSLTTDDITNTLTNLKSDGTNINTSINAIMSAFDGIEDNPLLYMKSLVAVAGNEALDTVMSHVIAAPLAKMFTSRNFGANSTEADKALKKLGVVDGLDGMNFNMSTIFSSDAGHEEEIHIVVYYKLKIDQIFGWTSLETTVRKDSVARAWLGGDDVQTKASPVVKAAEPTETSEEETSGEETSEVSEAQEVNTSTGIWAEQTIVDRNKKLREELSSYGYYEKSGNLLYASSGANKGAAVHGDCVTSWPSGGESIITNCLKDNAEYATNTVSADINEFYYYIYVPDNMPDDKYNQLVIDAQNAEKNFEAYAANNSDGVSSDFKCSVIVQKTTDTYDYEYHDNHTS